MTMGYPEPLAVSPVIVNRIAVMCRKLGLAVPEQPACPVTAEIGERGLWLHQSVLLGSLQDMDDIASAALKISRVWNS